MFLFTLVALLDAVILTNCLYDLKSLAPESIQEALQDFKSQRYPHVKKQFQASKLMAIFLNGQTLVERIIRKIAFNWMPSSIKDASMRKDAAYRPQLNFMPLAPTREYTAPKVLIAGAGIGGLYLAILLDKARIPYEIYERASKVKPLGSIMSLSANILASIEQIGLYEELKAISIQGSHHQSNIMYDNLDIIAALPDPNLDGAIGYEFHLFPRPDLHKLLLSKVPAERIHYDKDVVSVAEDKDGVHITCADGSTYKGDLLVGADGAYSGVRQSLFKTLKEENLLPPSDEQELPKGYICLVGTSDPLNPEEYPFVAKENCVFSQVIGRGTNYSWAEFNVPDNRVCWFVVEQLNSQAEADAVKFRNPEWKSELNDEAIKVCVRRHLILFFFFKKNFTFGSFPSLQQQQQQQQQQTAAHKLLPSGGMGAVCAMQDAVILTNCLYDLKSLSLESIKEALQDYKSQRQPHVEQQVEASRTMQMLLSGQTYFERFVRYIVFHWIPASIKNSTIKKDAAYRPQSSFLPLAPKRGTIDILPQKPSRRHEEEHGQHKEP
ncbi:hypothetical protein EMPS_06980 [Entomortierella parvispora]|uniref:FAD-binding domain-containing protein n=1 Tax=Entomortierella parvispora TaxID=205924 RepID=A0A9P3HDG4_9FUNG|nr:hypothetical protein EMPS_06980 [Entomortierella parvispora]